MQLVVFALDRQRFALPLSAVERALRVVDVLPLPRAPQIVRGIIDVAGQIVPVVAPRDRFGLPPRETALGDQLLLARSATRTLALLVDGVSGVADCDEADLAAPDVPGTPYVRGIAKLADGLVVIHDLDAFLSLDEEQALDHALADAADRDAD